jgi:hypothetical protein
MSDGVGVAALLGVLLLALAAFDLASWRWGVDSRDGIHSQEWDRRRSWPE